MTFKIWPHQEYGCDAVLAAESNGRRRIVLTSPTGGGKSWMIRELIRRRVRAGSTVIVYTNRRLLIDQLSSNMTEDGIDHGMRAAGHTADRTRPVQLSSVQTEASRVLKRESWPLFPAGLVLVDEGHLFTGGQAQELIRRHLAGGATVVYVSATPIAMDEVADVLVVAGTTSELRACGALVPAVHYGPDEPDLRGLKLAEGEDLSEPVQRKVMMTKPILGNVVDWYHKTNPGRRPSILFAPGVAESLWFAEHLTARGIPAAHIDGQDVWHAGHTYRSSPGARTDLLEASRNGDVAVLCNRFVLREGVDAPWLQHGVFACVFGSLQSYLQAGGRLLRRGNDIRPVTIQDHGGNWHRHGSLNADRVWRLDLTNAMLAGLRADRLRDGAEAKPQRCFHCGQIVMRFPCPCGFVPERGKRYGRPVVMRDGAVVEYHGDIVAPKVRREKPDTGDHWRKMYYRFRNGQGTFRQAEALFFHEHGYYPPRGLPLMPRTDVDWFRKVSLAPREDLF